MRTLIHTAIDEVLSKAGFRRKASAWSLGLEETILVVDLQKSNFGEQYYINLGVWLKGLATREVKLPPKEHQCHIRLRIDALQPKREEQLVQMLNLEDASLESNDRKRLLEEAVAHLALPFLMRCSTRLGIREADLQGQLDSALVHKDVREALRS